MNDTLLEIALAAAILIGSAIVTGLFAKTMYNRCAKCGTLNARRRDRCRACAEEMRR